MTTYREALNALLSVCDGAKSLDDHGFNGVDSPTARSLASFSVWSEKQQNLVVNILRKYSSQLLHNFSIDYYALTKEQTKEERVKAYEEAKKVVIPQERPILDYKENVFTLKIPFEQKDFAKDVGPHRWDTDRKLWTYHVNSKGIIDGLYNLIKTHPELNILVKPSASNYIDTYYKDKAQFDGAVKQVVSIKESEVPDIPVPLKTKPYDHQKRAYLIGTALNSAAFLMEMGTGKTLAAIAVAGKRFMDKEVDRLLVLAPLSILHVWKQEFEQHADFPVNVVVLNDAQMVKKKHKIDVCNKPDVLNVLIVSYETSWRMPDELVAWKPQMMILDESQRIKNKKAKRSEFVHELGDEVKYKLILTGTPVTQSPVDLFSQYRFLNKNIFGMNFYHFRNKYCQMGGYMNKVIVGFQNLDDLIEKAHSIAYRVTKEEALDLPDFTDQTMYFDLKDSLKIYKDMSKTMKVLIESGKCTAPVLLAQLTRLSQITGGFLPITDKSGKETVQQIGTEKLDLLKSIIEDFPRHKKLVIFCRFIPEIDAICKILEDMKISYSAITGDVLSSTRELINDNFQKKEDPKVIVLQIRVGGLGITLTAADTMIFFSNTFSYADYEQARARIHRSGQKNHCTYIQLIANNTIDATIVSALKSKKSVADMVVDQIDMPENELKTDNMDCDAEMARTY
jgi:SNF2 family DNA or RNA helicase